MTQDPQTRPAPDAPRPELDDAPPILGSWRNIYLVVLGNLALLVLLFWMLTKVYT